MSNVALFKIGGKILENLVYLKNTISQLSELYEEGLFQRIIIIPGGGSYANFIRSIYIDFGIDDEFAHWLAIYSLDYNGKELNKKFPKLIMIDNLEKLQNMNKTFCIFLPFKVLKEFDELPHNWDVTSDSITLYFAFKLKLSQCFLIKDVDGILDDNNQIIKQISALQIQKLREKNVLSESSSKYEDLKLKSKPIDAYLPSLIKKHSIECLILNGKSKDQRIINYFKNSSIEKKIFTKITSI